MLLNPISACGSQKKEKGSEAKATSTTGISSSDKSTISAPGHSLVCLFAPITSAADDPNVDTNAPKGNALITTEAVTIIVPLTKEGEPSASGEVNGVTYAVQDVTKVPLYQFDFLLKLPNSKKTYQVLVFHDKAGDQIDGLKASLTVTPWMYGNRPDGVCRQY